MAGRQPKGGLRPPDPAHTEVDTSMYPRSSRPAGRGPAHALLAGLLALALATAALPAAPPAPAASAPAAPLDLSTLLAPALVPGARSTAPADLATSAAPAPQDAWVSTVLLPALAPAAAVERDPAMALSLPADLATFSLVPAPPGGLAFSTQDDDGRRHAPPAPAHGVDPTPTPAPQAEPWAHVVVRP